MSLETEHRALRQSTGVTMLPNMPLIRASGDDAWERIDRAIASPLSVRDGQIRQALITDERGCVTADLYLGNDDGDLLLYGEGLGELGELGAREDTVCISVNGPFAWELLARLEDQDLGGFPYLSFFRPRKGWLYFRAGKTGEFGYDLFVPRAEAEATHERLLQLGAALDAIPVGSEALALASLENGFFNLEREGRFGLTPFELQLQWRVSFKKREWASGTRRITYFSTERSIAVADPVGLEGERIGEVLVVDRSPLIARFIGIALIDRRWAHSGIDAFTVEHAGDAIPMLTTSAPFVNNLSTFLKPGRDSYARRESIAFPGWKR